MQVEVVTIPVSQLQSIISDAVAKGVQLSKQNEVVEDTYISVTEDRELIGVKLNQTVIGMCDSGDLKFTYKIGVERKDGKAPIKTRLISKNSIIKFLNKKR